MIVLDASAAIEILLATPRGESVVRRLQREGDTLHAPHLIDVEVANVVRRYVRRREITSGDGAAALASWQLLVVARYEHGPLLDRVWELRENFTAYDAAYLSLTEALGASLLTTDAALRRARLRNGRVEVVA